jgi:hypothetical protein
MNDTPETDAAIKDQSKWMRPFVSTTFDGITYDSPVASLCRKLERERDEARAAFVIATDQMVIAQGKLREANKERDEAHKIAGRAIDDLAWFNETNAERLRAELDQLKEGAK